jgi:DNA-binding transcriptional MerR regulator
VAEHATELTIDELAREAGMTVRNVRAYRQRGLISEPELRGRKGFYGPEHLARLRLVRDLKERGFSLESIAQLIERAPADALGDALEFTHSLFAPATDEAPRVVSGAVFAQRWGEQLTPALARRAERVGLVRRVGPDEWEIRSPRLERAAQALSELGIPLEDALSIATLLKRHAGAVANAYVELFIKRIWEPFDDAGEPKEEWPRVRESLDRLRPLAGESLLAVFQLMMREAIEQELTAMATRAPTAKRSPAKRSTAKRSPAKRSPAKRS